MLEAGPQVLRRVPQLTTNNNMVGETNDRPANLDSTAVPASTPQITGVPSTVVEALVTQALDQQLKAQNQAPLVAFSEKLGPETPDEYIVTVLRVLNKASHRLDTQHVAPLIHAVLSVNCPSRSEQVRDAFTRFCELLAAGAPRWWREVAESVASNFVEPRSSTNCHHQIVRHILHHIPASSHGFAEILSSNFPHKHAPAEETINYLDNLLYIAEYALELQSALYGLIVEKLVELDAEVDGELLVVADDDDDEEDEDDDEDDEEEEEEDASDSSDEEADLEPESADLDTQTGLKRLRADESDADIEHKKLKLENIGEDEELGAEELAELMESHVDLASKLDMMLTRLLAYLDTRFVPDGDQNTAGRLFVTLLESFMRLVLPTHTTRSVQFLLFHITQTHPELIETFLATLLDVALDPQADADRRQRAAQYVSSFVARARHLEQSQLEGVVVQLAGWLRTYIAEREHEVEFAGSMARFRPFYAIAQALLYVFCFRHRLLRLSDSTGNTTWVADLDKLLPRLIVSKFNPLRYCKSTVVAMFARIARREDVAYCFSVMEQNRVGRTRSVDEQSPGANNSSNGSLNSRPASSRTSITSLAQLSHAIWPDSRDFAVLEGWFPFDPLSLQNTKQMLKSDYIEWNEVNTDSGSGSSGDDDDDEDDFEDDDQVELVDVVRV